MVTFSIELVKLIASLMASWTVSSQSSLLSKDCIKAISSEAQGSSEGQGKSEGRLNILPLLVNLLSEKDLPELKDVAWGDEQAPMLGGTLSRLSLPLAAVMSSPTSVSLGLDSASSNRPGVYTLVLMGSSDC